MKRFFGIMIGLWLVMQWNILSVWAAPSVEALRLRNELTSILKDSGFHYQDRWPWLTHILSCIFSWLHKMNPFGFHHSWGRFDTVFQRIGLLLLALLPLALFWVGNKFMLREARQKQKNSTSSIFPHPLGYREYRQAAEHLKMQEDYCGAIRQLYWAALDLLGKQGQFRGIHLSDMEILRTLREKRGNTDPVFLSFDGLVRLFQEKWYGLKACSRDDYQHAVNLLNTLCAASPSCETASISHRLPRSRR